MNREIYVVYSVLRQINGESASALLDYVGVKFEAAFSAKEKAAQYAEQLARTSTTKVMTPDGEIECLCERGVQPMQLDLEN